MVVPHPVTSSNIVVHLRTRMFHRLLETSLHRPVCPRLIDRQPESSTGPLFRPRVPDLRGSRLPLVTSVTIWPDLVVLRNRVRRLRGLCDLGVASNFWAIGFLSPFLVPLIDDWVLFSFCDFNSITVTNCGPRTDDLDTPDGPKPRFVTSSSLVTAEETERMRF